MKYVGRHKSGALLGFHHFTGADWGGTFGVLSKKTWMTAFLSLDDNDHIVETTSRLGEGPISISTDDVNETTTAMPASVNSLETFVCKNFSGQTILRAKWSTYRWHIDSTHTAGQLHMVKQDRGPHPSVPNLEDDGWS